MVNKQNGGNMKIVVRDEPDFAKNYEFEVVRKVDGEYFFYGAYADGFQADIEASKIGGLILHNVRIQGIRRGGE